ncbi:hypothetical protein [Herminiimonas sp. CN]|uniref:hypothetical protein n=1 Tax=Herminiimonas sp. CN TaxID=1349818 RepID=UPI0012DF1758|nr:hypothetical protein [Herminiimonas sp. CN]
MSDVQALPEKNRSEASLVARTGVAHNAFLYPAFSPARIKWLKQYQRDMAALSADAVLQ